MATKRQVEAARKNIEGAQEATRRKRTIAHLPEAVKHDLGKQAASRVTRSRIETASSSMTLQSGTESRDARGWGSGSSSTRSAPPAFDEAGGARPGLARRGQGPGPGPDLIPMRSGTLAPCGRHALIADWNCGEFGSTPLPPERLKTP